jgi:hypothetical protein
MPASKLFPPPGASTVFPIEMGAASRDRLSLPDQLRWEIGMETRPYFLFGDILSNTLLGAILGALAAVAVSPRWPMLLAMAAGMIAGMLLSIVLGVLGGMLFGAFELMIPMMLTGMAAGMAIPMRAAMQPLTPLAGAGLGAAIGLLALAATYILNAFLHGKERQWTA